MNNLLLSLGYLCFGVVAVVTVVLAAAVVREIHRAGMARVRRAGR
jgi:hypothetical protein